MVCMDRRGYWLDYGTESMSFISEKCYHSDLHGCEALLKIGKEEKTALNKYWCVSRSCVGFIIGY